MDRRTLLRLAAIGLVAPGVAGKAAAGTMMTMGTGKPGSAGPSSSAVTWDPATKGTLINLTGGNLIATHDGTNNQNTVVANTALGATDVYWEIVVNTINGNAFSPIRAGVALQDNTAAHAGGIGNIGVNHSGGISIFEGQIQSDFGTTPNEDGQKDAPGVQIATNGQTLGFAWKGSTKRLFITPGGGIWYGKIGVTDNPATATGGLDCSTALGALYPALTLWAAGDQATWQSGATAFTPPAGFTRF